MEKNIQIIINADDYGFDNHKCDVILDAMKNGLITDTTLIANSTSFDYAARIALENECMNNRVGIHFNLTFGKPLTYPITKCSKLVRGGVFTKYLIYPRNYLIPLNKEEKEAIYIELSAQVEKILSAGINITHADSHQHVHNNWQVISIIKNVLVERYIYKIRLFKNVVDKGLIKNKLIDLYNYTLSRKGVVTTDYFGNLCEINNICDGVTEIMVHLDYDQTGQIVNIVTNFGQLSAEQNLKEKVKKLQISEDNLINYFELK